MDIEATLARADLHEFKGKTAKQAREMRELLRTAQSALETGRSEVVAQRIDAVIRVLTSQMEK